MSNTTAAAHERSGGPILRVTGFDRASALVIAAVIGLLLSVGLLLGAWASQHEWQDEAVVPLEVIDVSGGEADGSLTETLELKNQFEEIPDPSLAEIRDDQTQIEPMLDSVVDLADQATDMARQQTSADLSNTGRPGSASGTGSAALGMGSGKQGVPREQRWFVRFDDGGTSQLYARQLDSFGIELAALLPRGELVYLSDLASDSPKVRRVESGEGENRLYFTWQGGGRQTADIELFTKAGIEVGAAPIFHFYPKKAEGTLARLELEYRDKPVQEIRRTYFLVEGSGAHFEFVVSRQVYFQ